MISHLIVTFPVGSNGSNAARSTNKNKVKMNSYDMSNYIIFSHE